MGNLLIKRIYEPVDKADGVRILVDRLWPRGLKKEQAAIAQWMKDAAPSTTLRKWFNHDPQKWPMFQQEYISELTYRKSVKELIQCIQNNETVTLLYATSSHEYNHARVLQQFLLSVLKSGNGS